MNKIKACIFDLDGVIVDTAKYHFLAWKKLTDEMNIPFTTTDNERLKGVSRMACMDILLELGNISLDEDEKIKLATKKNAWYLELISDLNPSEILPGTNKLLTTLKEGNIKIALGSASKNAMTILNSLNLVSYFDSIIDGTKVENAKPDPEVFLKAAEELNIAPEDCVVFEDSQAGIEAALNGKMLCVGIGSDDNLKGSHILVTGLDKVNMDILNSL